MNTAALRARIEEQIRRHELIASDGEVVALVSGGADSTCLWHALRELGYRVARTRVGRGRALLP
jgi:tRNA(Ile)-lysidine synthase TilS/MesJ